jgi:hypothetical protein
MSLRIPARTSQSGNQPFSLARVRKSSDGSPLGSRSAKFVVVCDIVKFAYLENRLFEGASIEIAA